MSRSRYADESNTDRIKKTYSTQANQIIVLQRKEMLGFSVDYVPVGKLMRLSGSDERLQNPKIPGFSCPGYLKELFTRGYNLSQSREVTTCMYAHCIQG
jgi:hypothetical protein